MERKWSNVRTWPAELKGRFEERIDPKVAARLRKDEIELSAVLTQLVHRYRNEPEGEGSEEMVLIPRTVLEQPEGKNYADQTSAYACRELLMWASDDNYNALHITDRYYREPRRRANISAGDGDIIQLRREHSVHFSVVDGSIGTILVTRFQTIEREEFWGNRSKDLCAVLTGREKAKIFEYMLEKLRD